MKKRQKNWKGVERERVPRERDACSGHTRERRNQPRCDRRMKWRNRSWIRRVSTPFHPRIKVRRHGKNGSITQDRKQPKSSSLDPNRSLFDFAVGVYSMKESLSQSRKI